MGCGCSKPKCGCSKPKCDCETLRSCHQSTNCPSVCSAILVSNSWNIPSCGNDAVLQVSGLETALIGASIYNPSYGWFRVSAFDSLSGQLTITNDCIDGNASPGSVVPALTTFIFGAPPANTNITFSAYSSGTFYTITGSTAAVVFGTTSPSITLTSAGTYLIMAGGSLFGNSLILADYNTVNIGVNRLNNTPGTVIPLTTVVTYGAGNQFFTLDTIRIPPYIYSTSNTDDILSVVANWQNMPSSGTLQMSNADIVAIKLY